MESKFRVVIVGGGSAGWMTAAYLSQALYRGVDIQLVESPNINTIGVGEATFSTIRLFFDFLGLREEDWMHHCNASYKLAIRFVDWNAERRHFYHPFQRFDSVDSISMIDWWLKLKRNNAPFDYSCFSVPAICDAQRSPRFHDGHVFDRKVDGYLSSHDPNRALLLEELKIQYPYAYHFDAGLIAKFMAGYAQERGVRQIMDDVLEVKLAENGFIQGVRTQNHGMIEGDLFVDCTGFRGLLVNQTLNEPFISFSEFLPNDSAIALQIPSHPEAEGINPYTTATALSSGWAWNIPLFNRVGTGYVYCSAFQTAESAEQEFRTHLGKRSEGCKANHIKMRIGRNRNSWVKNCVAIGLASGFVEPLESTGIFFIQHGIEQLAAHFPRRAFDQESIAQYNRSVADVIDGVRDFLILHYAASSRNDTPFWKATKTDFSITPELRERLQLWKRRLPTNRNINPKYHGFEAYSYAVMLLGLGYYPDTSLPLLGYKDDHRAWAAFDGIQQESLRLVETLPPLHDYLTQRYQHDQSCQLAVAVP
ncbi:MAG TPA: tryptophan halogenase family protein [Candidatus Angelobacter sp.]|nr:tryptophan halogenase family protein [Candidatus Angelobacter sp.]